MLFAIILAFSLLADTQKLREALQDLNAGRLEQAEQKLQSLAADTPRDAEVHFQLGVVRFRRGRLAQAREALDHAARLAPSRASVWKALGVTWAAEKEYARAEEPFRRACSLDAREPDACFYLARNLYLMNRFEKAIDAYTAALATDPHPWRIHNGLALSLEGLGRAPGAGKHFRRAVELYRGAGRPDEHPRIDLVNFLFKQGRLAEARAEAEPLAREAPSSRSSFAKARILFQMGQLEECARELERAIALDGKNGQAHLLLGKALYRMGRAADAERHTRIGRELEGAPPAPAGSIAPH